MTGPEVTVAILTLFVGPLLLYAARHWWERRRWERFASSIAEFARAEVIDDRLSMNDLQALVANKLSDSGYEPLRAKALMPIAVWFAAGRISHERRGPYLGDLAKPHTEEQDGVPHDA